MRHGNTAAATLATLLGFATGMLGCHRAEPSASLEPTALPANNPSSITAQASATPPEAATAGTAPAATAQPACPRGEVYIPATAPEGFVMGRGYLAGRAEKNDGRDFGKGHRANTDVPHRVILTKPFCIDAAEVTVGEYRACIENGSCPPPLSRLMTNGVGKERHPVNAIGWRAARAFCRMHKKELPTEAQWEWAATGGDGRTYPWGDEPPDCERADYVPGVLPRPSASVGCNGGGTSEVGTHEKGARVWPGGKLHDLAGNVWEWCLDTYAVYRGDAIDPLIVSSPDAAHVIRGGGWNRSHAGLRAAFRGAARADYQVPGLGVRCVRNDLGRVEGTDRADAVPAAKTRVSLIAGGDLFFGRVLGQHLLARPILDPFARLRPLLATADLQFGNLECQLSDQHGETVSPHNHLVFTGPPGGADALAAAGFDLVSLANNHMWDYGKPALFETFANLERAKVEYVGAGRDAARAQGHTVLERNGLRLAFVAVTDVWNQGPLAVHPGHEHVAMAAPDSLARAVAAARKRAEVVVVSYHGGSEYMEEPLVRTRAILHSAVDAGADLVLGHHPHVVQGIGWYKERPIVYSLGNVTMGFREEYPWGRFGMLARATFEEAGATSARLVSLAVCPFAIAGYEPAPLTEARDAPLAAHFFRRLEFLSKKVRGSDIAAAGADGCALVTPPTDPVPGAVP